MRQLGTLGSELEARRFTAYLISKGIDAHVDHHDQTWTIWVRDEDRKQEARDEFERFKSDPFDDRYEQGEREAAAILRQRREKQEKARRAVVDVRGRWRAAGRMPTGPRPPLASTLVLLSVVVTLIGWFGQAGKDSLGAGVYEALYFVTFRDFLANGVFGSIQRGEIWRVITPMFLHLSPLHLLFNMFWLYSLGKQIEWLRGSARLGGLVLLVATVAHLAEAMIESPRFGGMSGVVYGLFGYVWIRRMVDPGSGFQIDPASVFILLLWLVICFSGSAGPVANWAHLGGLLCGMLIGYLPVLRGRALQ